MSPAWSAYGSSLRSNATLAADIPGALNWMFTNRCNPSKRICDHRHDFEIGVPLNLTDIAARMYDGLGLAGLSNSMAAVDKFTPSPSTPAAGGTTTTCTGADRADKLRAVAVRGSVVKDSARLTAARDALGQLFLCVTSGDGFYTDGAFIQHTHHPYQGSYGSVLPGDMANVLPCLQGSPWQCLDAAQTNVFLWVNDACEPFIYKGAMMVDLGNAASATKSAPTTKRHAKPSEPEVLRRDPVQWVF